MRILQFRNLNHLSSLISKVAFKLEKDNMKILLITLFLIFNILGKGLAKEKSPHEKLVATAPRIEGCGGVITSETGVISYKPNEQIQSQERCVWIIRPVNATDFTLFLTSVGFESTPAQHQIILSKLKLTYMLSSVVASDVSPAEYEINANAILVTFYTGDLSSTHNKTGFRLGYTSKQNDDLKAAVSSTDVVLANDGEMLRYPKFRENFASRELSTFLWTRNSPTEMISAFIANEMKSGCSDMMLVSTFNGTFWDGYYDFCEGVPSKIIRNQDLMLLVFHASTLPSVSQSTFTLGRAGCEI